MKEILLILLGVSIQSAACEDVKIKTEVRTGINIQNFAISNDGKYVIIGNYLPNNVVIFNTKDLSTIKIIEAKDSDGNSSRVSGVYSAPPRYSFIVALKDVKEVWEIPYSDEGGVVVYKGWAHDYRKDGGEGKVENWKSGDPFPIRRIMTDDYLDDFFFDPNYINLIGKARNSHNAQVINLDIKKKVATIAFTGAPNLGSAITWNYQGKAVLAAPNTKENKVTIVEMENWQVIKEIKTEGTGLFIRNHSKSSYFWVAVRLDSNHEKLHIINKNTLEIVKTLSPTSRKNTAKIEFTNDGKHVLLSGQKTDAPSIIYDAKTLEVVKHLPMELF